MTRFSAVPDPARPLRPAASVPAAGVRLPYLSLSLVFVSALDVIFTYAVLVLGGMEANPIANAVLESPAGFHGLIGYKFVIVAAVILIAEFIARHALDTARRLMLVGIAISAFPVVWSLSLLSQHL
ncbi:MAG: DUF5658 family protein [Planctomycetota bacterium]